MADIAKQERKVFELIDMPVLEKWLHYAKWAVENKVAPKNMTVPEYFMVLQAGNDMGMDLAMIHNSLAIINGRVVMWGKEVLARAKRAGYKVKYTEKSEIKVTVTLSKDREEHTETYTIDKAKRAWLLSRDNWMKYPEEMLTHKAVARAIDNFCPEVLGGYSMAEDMDEPITQTPKKKPNLSQMWSEEKEPEPIEAEVEESGPPEDVEWEEIDDEWNATK